MQFLFNIVKSICLVALMGGSASAAKLYEWKDADGTLTYSTEPPPESVTMEYREISSTLSAKKISKEKRHPTTSVQAVKQNSISSKPESKLQRMVRLAPPLKKNSGNAGQTAKTRPVDYNKVRQHRRCADLVNRISALESRISVVENAEQLNQAILLISQYQSMHDRDCISTK